VESKLGPLGTAATYMPIVLAPGDWEIGVMTTGRGNRSTRRKPDPVPFCPPQTPHAARTRTRAAAVGSQRLTAWPTARSHPSPNARECLTPLQITDIISRSRMPEWETSHGFGKCTQWYVYNILTSVSCTTFLQCDYVVVHSPMMLPELTAAAVRSSRLKGRDRMLTTRLLKRHWIQL
jgi:hypothetical protein